MSNLKNALALFIRAETLSGRALSAAPPSSPIEKGAPLKLDIHPELTKALHTKLEHLVLQHRALVQLQGFESSAGVKGESSGSSNPLVEQLDEYPAAGVDLSNIVTYPPKLRPVPVKPLFFDLAWNYIQYPGQETWSAKAKQPDKSNDKEEKKPAKRGWFGFG
jgi:signal recognition particle subunit SRP68